MSTPTDPTAGEGLSEAERFALGNTVRDVIGRSYGFDAICRQVERIVAARESAAATRARAEALREAADALRSMAAQEFDIKGPRDPRGAAIWDSASWLTERADSLAPDTAGESA